ncbi:MAG: hypothetical protein A3G75_03165 [Verrucomicrobia bacterium RIFCSPLOWO2_12_FULL_64_8]|nr:MAG: hypothetical protein A3G75_03165 [Verrucomicrobia bacterium RIFCSPLOWO2_12_FULL_64_8]
MKLKNKVVLVTGAAKRIGRELALAAAQRGARVAIHFNRSAREARSLADEIRSRFCAQAQTFRADLLKIREAQTMVNAVVRHYGALDVLINNASIFERVPCAAVRESDWDRNLNLHLKSPFFMAQAAAPHMRRRGEGKIINIADWAGLRLDKDYIAYGVSKAALIALTQALAKALAPSVQVNAVLPGPVLLPEKWGRAARDKIIAATPLKRIGSPADVRETVLFLIEGSDFITGAQIAVDGGRLIA